MTHSNGFLQCIYVIYVWFNYASDLAVESYFCSLEYHSHLSTIHTFIYCPRVYASLLFSIYTSLSFQYKSMQTGKKCLYISIVKIECNNIQ